MTTTTTTTTTRPEHMRYLETPVSRRKGHPLNGCPDWCERKELHASESNDPELLGFAHVGLIHEDSYVRIEGRILEPFKKGDGYRSGMAIAYAHPVLTAPMATRIATSLLVAAERVGRFGPYVLSGDDDREIDRALERVR